MEKQARNEKMITALIAGLVLILAVFGSEFRSYGESANTANMHNEFEVVAFESIDREELFPVEIYEVEPVLKTAKLYNEQGEMIEMLILQENENIEEVYTGELFNKAEYLTSYGDVSVYRVTE